MEVVERAKADAANKGAEPIERQLSEAQRKIIEEKEEAERKRRAQIEARAEYAKVRVDPFDVHSRGSGTASRQTHIVMPWGKHKGQLISELPTGYIDFALRSDWKIKPYLRQSLAKEIEARRSKPPASKPAAASDARER